MADSPCRRELAKQADYASTAVASALAVIDSTTPSISCQRKDNTARAMATACGDLLARIFPSVHLDIQDPDILAATQAAIHSANPDAVLVNVKTGPCISVGAADEKSTCIDAAGWRVTASSPNQAFAPLPENHEHPATPLLAAALGVARLVATIPKFVNEAGPSEPSRVNLWSNSYDEDGPEVPSELSIDCHVFGHGSISHATWGPLQNWTKLRGRIVAIDYDHYDDRNPARYALLSNDALNLSKVSQLKSQLRRHTDLAVDTQEVRIQAWRAKNSDSPKLALISPDNKAARAWAADTWPEFAVVGSADDREARVALVDHRRGICAYCPFAPSNTPDAELWDAISAYTGLDKMLVQELTQECKARPENPLQEQHVRVMEKKRRLWPGAYNAWIGKLLMDYWTHTQRQRYSEARVESGQETSADLPVPMVSAAAGAMSLAALLRISLHHFDGASAEWNHMCLDIWRQQPVFVPEGRPESLTCICQNGARLAWRSQGGPP